MIKLFLIASLVFVGCKINAQEIVNFSQINHDTLTFKNSLIFEINANSNLGYNYPYLLYIPNNLNKSTELRILVEPNNTGTSSDSFELHLNKAIQLISKAYPRMIADSLRIPLLIPVFPRPRYIANTYTHALDRDALLIKKGNMLARIDLQLIAMIKHAQSYLISKGFSVEPKVFLDGFSASGLFVNRFAVLHPQIVRAVAVGGINGLPIIPMDSLDNNLLPYPIGIGDIKSIVNIKFDFEEYKKVSQYIFMGGFDRNDTYCFPDAWDDSEREIIKNLFGRKMMPDRWEKSQYIINKIGFPIQLVTYNGINHRVTNCIIKDIVTFFSANNDNKNVRIEPHKYPFVEYKEISHAHINKIYWPGDTSLPSDQRNLMGAQFAISIEEYYKNQDCIQLREFQENAGFNFSIKVDGGKIIIDKSNSIGRMSSINPETGSTNQMFCVRLSENDFQRIKPSKKNKLKPINLSKKYFWSVNKNVRIIRPFGEEE